jgi:DNA repair exonuclease SbcCD ATPase subunit
MSETKLNHDEASKALEKILKDRKCSVKDVDNKEIIDVLKESGVTTSNSTSGPILRSVIDDALLAEAASFDNVRPILLASFIRDRENLIKVATEGLRRQSQKDAEEHGKTLDELELTVREMNELSQKLLDEQKRNLEIEKTLAQAEGKISTFESTKTLMDNQLDNMNEDLKRERDEAGKLKSNLKTLEKREQDLSARNKSLEEQYRDQFSELQKVQEKLLTLTAENADAGARLEERSKLLQNFEATFVEETPSELTEETQDNKTQTSTGKTKPRGRATANTDDKSKTGT